MPGREAEFFSEASVKRVFPKSFSSKKTKVDTYIASLCRKAERGTTAHSEAELTDVASNFISTNSLHIHDEFSPVLPGASKKRNSGKQADELSKSLNPGMQKVQRLESAVLRDSSARTTNRLSNRLLYLTPSESQASRRRLTPSSQASR